MAATAFVIGFFTAFGWWSAGKITSKIDQKPAVVIQQETKQEKENQK
jgi:hypothetical protein